MVEARVVTLADLLLFIYLEVLAMVVIYLDSGKLPVPVTCMAGDLDECNGMTVNGQYGYDAIDSYPWIIACHSGTPDPSFTVAGGEPPPALKEITNFSRYLYCLPVLFPVAE